MHFVLGISTQESTGFLGWVGGGGGGLTRKGGGRKVVIPTTWARRGSAHSSPGRPHTPSRRGTGCSETRILRSVYARL